MGFDYYITEYIEVFFKNITETNQIFVISHKGNYFNETDITDNNYNDFKSSMKKSGSKIIFSNGSWEQTESKSKKDLFIDLLGLHNININHVESITNYVRLKLRI